MSSASRFPGIIDNASTFQRGYPAKHTDLRWGGQMGYAPDLTTWVANAPHVARNVVLIMLEPPRFMLNLPDKEIVIGSCREFFENMPHTVTGLTNTLNIETDSVPFGRDGNIQEFYTNVKYTNVQLQMTMHERYNRGIWRFLHMWVRMSMMDPQTGIPAAMTIPGMQLEDGLPDQWSATLLAFEQDHNGVDVTQAWLLTNVAPKDTIENISQRNMTGQGYQKQELQLGFTSIVQRGPGVDHLAKTILNRMSPIGADPHLRLAYLQDIDPSVAARPHGYGQGIANLAAHQVKV